MLIDTDQQNDSFIIKCYIFDMVIDIDIIKYNILATHNSSRECGSTVLEFLHLEYFDITLITFMLKVPSLF